jgi:hypothetical protein
MCLTNGISLLEQLELQPPSNNHQEHAHSSSSIHSKLQFGHFFFLAIEWPASYLNLLGQLGSWRTENNCSIFSTDLSISWAHGNIMLLPGAQRTILKNGLCEFFDSFTSSTMMRRSKQVGCTTTYLKNLK